MFWQKISYDPFQTPVYESPTPNDEEIDELATEADQAGGGGGDTDGGDVDGSDACGGGSVCRCWWCWCW